MRTLIALAAFLAAVALLVAGCGGYGNGSKNNKPGGGTTTNSGY